MSIFLAPSLPSHSMHIHLETRELYKALSEKFNSPISLLVKENSKADQYLYQTKYIDKILLLDKDHNTTNSR